MRRELLASKKKAEKFFRFYYLLVHWVELLQEGRTVKSYFAKKGYKTVAIYGMKELGERLFEELKGSDIVVKYCIDSKADDLYAEVDILYPDSDLADVDVIVVTAINNFNEIRDYLEKRTDFPVISLEDVIFGM